MRKRSEDGCGRCSVTDRDTRLENKVPGARSWETPAETEERKWISCLMRRRPRALTTVERRVLGMLYALGEDQRRTECADVASELDLAGPAAVHAIAVEALRKICYDAPVRRRGRAAK